MWLPQEIAVIYLLATSNICRYVSWCIELLRMGFASYMVRVVLHLVPSSLFCWLVRPVGRREIC
jgi:hypothetical protein